MRARLGSGRAWLALAAATASSGLTLAVISQATAAAKVPAHGPALAGTQLAASSSAAGASAPRVTQSIRATLADASPTRTYTSPYLVADPENPKILVGAVAELRTKTCHLLRSTDAGVRWTILDASPSPKDYPFCTSSAGEATQTPIAFGRNHVLYFGLNGWSPQDPGPTRGLSVLLARSDDLGGSWTSTVLYDARTDTTPRPPLAAPVSSVVVDTNRGGQDIVYVVWRSRPPVDNSERALLAVSTDGGRHFSPGADVSAQYTTMLTDPQGKQFPIYLAFGVPQLALDNQGTLYILYPPGVPGFGIVQPLAMIIGRSTDQGKSWTFNPIGPPSPYNEFIQQLKWTPQGGPKGTLHVVYEDKVNQPANGADRDIYYFHSTDGGLTSSPAVKLNDDDPAKRAGQFTPDLSVAPNGRIDAAWWDFRNDPGIFENDVYYTYSNDNGATWAKNIRVSDHSIRRMLGTWSNGFDIRQPPGVTSTNTEAVFAWDDTRLGDQTSQTQDVFASVVQFGSQNASTSDNLHLVIAGLLGLAAAGAVLLAFAFATRNRRRPAPGA